MDHDFGIIFKKNFPNQGHTDSSVCVYVFLKVCRGCSCLTMA